MSKKHSFNIRWCFDASKDSCLQFGARALYWQIFSLSRLEGYCWANNHFFSELFDVDKSTISRWIKELEQNKYIRVELDQAHGNKRYLFPIPPPPPLMKKKTTRTGAMTPHATHAHPSLEKIKEALGTDVDSLMCEDDEALLIPEEHNEEIMIEDKETEIYLSNEDEVPDVVVADNEVELQTEDEHSEKTTTNNNSLAVNAAGLLASGKKLAEMPLAEQTEIVMAFTMHFEEIPDLKFARSKINKFLSSGGKSENLIQSIWNFQFTEFGGKWESKLNYFLGNNTTEKIVNALGNIGKLGKYAVSDAQIELAKPFSDILIRNLNGIDGKKLREQDDEEGPVEIEPKRIADR